MFELVQTPGSRTRALEFEVEEFTITDFNLMKVYNAVIASIDAKPAIKKKFIFTPKKPNNATSAKKKKRKMTLKDLERIKIAQPDEQVVNLDAVETVRDKVYHIDRKNVIRRCRANGVNCSVSDNHFDETTKDKRS